MKAVNLGELESQVMDIIWSKKSSSVNDVLDELKKNRNISYTTLSTILHRLCTKKLIAKKQQKSFYVYTPCISKSEYGTSLVSSFMNNILSNFGDTAITSFAESLHKLPKKEKTKLLKILESYEGS